MATGEHQSLLVIKVFWLIGFSISVMGLIFQIMIYYLIPCSRKLPQKLLSQLTIARLLNVILEFMVCLVPLHSAALVDSVYALYVQTDAALICWMFVFTKNLFDDVIVVFKDKISFTIITVIIWLVTFPIGLICPLMLELDKKNKFNTDYFDIFYRTYAVVKFIILTLNLVLYSVIIRVALMRGKGNLKTCLVSFGLVSISSAQVLLTDILSYSFDKYPMVSLAFAVMNSFQVVAITSMFVILVQNNSEESLKRKIVKKFLVEKI